MNVDSAITPVTGTSGSVAAATATATIAATAGKLNYLEGFDVTGGGATAASIVSVTVTGLQGGTLTYSLAVVAGATVNVNPLGGLSVRFPQAIPATAANVAIAVVVPSLGSGNTNATAVAYGYM